MWQEDNNAALRIPISNQNLIYMTLGYELQGHGSQVTQPWLHMYLYLVIRLETVVTL